MLIIFILFFIIIFLVYRNYYCKYDKSSIIKTLVRQAARWTIAANQDKNAMIALLHANYGAGYLWALRDIATDTEIENAGNLDVLKFRDKIINTQDKITLRVANMCNNFAPNDTYLTRLGK